MAKQTFHVCYHCKDRYIGCHSKCELYLNEVKENEDRKKNGSSNNFINSTLKNMKRNAHKVKRNPNSKVYKTHKK